MKKKLMMCVLVAAIPTSGALLGQQDEMKMPGPEPEHAWLQQLVGEWESECEMFMDPAQPMKSKGSETVRAVGGFWIVAENKGATPMGTPMNGLMTLGYDPKKQKYVGNWVDSMTSYMWVYEGTMDGSKKVLTLDTEGENPMAPGTRAKFRDVIEIQGRDQKTLSSSMLNADGTWTTFMKVSYQRKK